MVNNEKNKTSQFIVRGIIIGVVYQTVKYFYYQVGYDYKYPNFNQDNMINCMYSGFDFHDDFCLLLQDDFA